jgi:hypothetical protein
MLRLDYRPPQRQAGGAVGADHDVGEKLDFDRRQGLLDAGRDGAICSRG